MHLSPSDYLEIRHNIRRILQKELAPLVAESEEKALFCHDVYRSLGREGFAAPILPAPYGMGDLYAQLIVAEELGRVSSGFGLSLLASVGLFGSNVARLGSPQQQEKYLPGIASGEKIGCWALTEPDNGSDAVGITTTCRQEGNKYFLNGSKTFITNGPIADYFIIIAKDKNFAGNSNGNAGGTGTSGKESESFETGVALLVERGMPGISTGNPLHKMGHLSSPTGEIFLQQVPLEKEQILGEYGKAFYDMKYSLNVERLIFAGLGIGMMDFCLETMIQYGLERKQFQRPLADFQMYQDKLARTSTLLDVNRIYLQQLVQQLQQGRNITRAAAQAKLSLSEACFQVARDAVQCLGGNGYMREYQVERCLRDAKLFEIGGGTSEIQKLIIAKEIVREWQRGTSER